MMAGNILLVVLLTEDHVISAMGDVASAGAALVRRRLCEIWRSAAVANEFEGM